MPTPPCPDEADNKVGEENGAYARVCIVQYLSGAVVQRHQGFDGESNERKNAKG
jgi:hypothetical protein